MKQAPKGDYRLPDGRTKLLAHDVRHMTQCAKCARLGDGREMVNQNGQKWHPVCFYHHHGRATTLALPRSEQRKFCLCDVPAAVMRTMLDRHSAAVGKDIEAAVRRIGHGKRKSA